MSLDAKMTKPSLGAASLVLRWYFSSGTIEEKLEAAGYEIDWANRIIYPPSKERRPPTRWLRLEP